MLALTHCCSLPFKGYDPVPCRTGSLEKHRKWIRLSLGVPCRTGSLEKIPPSIIEDLTVPCRTGSLEKYLQVC